MSKSLYSKPMSRASVQTAELHCAPCLTGTEALPIHPVRLILPGRNDTPSATAPKGGTLPSPSTTHELIDQTASRLLIYKYASNVNEANDKVKLGAVGRSVTKVIRGFIYVYDWMLNTTTLLTTTLRTELIQKKSRALRLPSYCIPKDGSIGCTRTGTMQNECEE